MNARIRFHNTYGYRVSARLIRPAKARLTQNVWMIDVVNHMKYVFFRCSRCYRINKIRTVLIRKSGLLDRCVSCHYCTAAISATFFDQWNGQPRKTR